MRCDWESYAFGDPSMGLKRCKHRGGQYRIISSTRITVCPPWAEIRSSAARFCGAGVEYSSTNCASPV